MNILSIYFDFKVQFHLNSHATSHPRPTGQPGMGIRFLGGPAIPIWDPPEHWKPPNVPNSDEQPLTVTST